MKLKLSLLWSEKVIVFTLITLSWLLFFVIVLCIEEGAIKHQSVSIKTVDLAYKALENFIFLSISGVFLFSQIDDHKSQKRHMLRVQTGLRSSAYYLAQFTTDFLLYAILCVPSLVMVVIGYRHMELGYRSLPWLVLIEALSKLAFGCVLLPLIYLLGFWQRTNAENVYKNLGVFLYLFGHLFTMVILSLLVEETNKDIKLCTESTLLLALPMLNPFTFYFLNSTIDYFICAADSE